MHIIVLNGSPKGDLSVTMQYVRYLQQEFPQATWEIANVAQRIKKLAQDPQAFEAIVDKVRAADGVLWGFPIYFCLVPYGYKRFIELIWEHDAAEAFAGKYTAALSTSIHFYDHTAHNYIHAICDDLGMRYVDFLSADMQDLLKEGGRATLRAFGAHFLDAIAGQQPMARVYPPVTTQGVSYTPGPVGATVDLGGRRLSIITDAEPHQANLIHMTERFAAVFTGGEVETVNLRDLDIKGGCLGCVHCGYDNECAYAGKDDFIPFYERSVKGADLLVFAGAIRDRHLSARWKMFFDRSFYNGHVPTMRDKQVGFLISGPLGQIPNMRESLIGRLEVQPANVAGFVTDERGDAAHIDGLLDVLAARMARFAEEAYVRPPTFLGVGGEIIFRDNIWGPLRAVFLADHRTYKRMGFYDTFPQRNWKARMINLVAPLLFRIRPVREAVQDRIVEGMIAPYQKVIAAASEK